MASPYLACVGAFCSRLGVGWAPPPPGGQRLQRCHFGGGKALAAESRVGKLAMPGARGGSLGHAHSTASPRLRVARTPCSLALFRFVFHWSPCACLRVSPRPLCNGMFHWPSESPSGLPVTFLQETRVKQLPRSAWPGCAGALVLGGSGPEIPAPHRLPLPAPPPHPHQKLLRIGLSNPAHLLKS